MKRFLHGHATHPDWRAGLALAVAQIEAQRGSAGHVETPTLGWVYLTDGYATHAEALLGELQRRWPDVAWVGASGVGIAASGVEYFDEGALALMLTDLPRSDFRVYSGTRPLAGFDAHTALVHADPTTPDLPELIVDLSERTSSGYLFGGLASGRTPPLHIADGVLRGALSGVAFTDDVALVSRVTQGCQPIGPQRRIDAAERHVVTELDGEPALDCLLRDANLTGRELQAAIPALRRILVGLTDAGPRAGSSRRGDGRGDGRSDGRPDDDTTPDALATAAQRGAFGAETRVRHLVGLDPARRGVAIADNASVGMQLAFCSRDVQAARRDLMRICAEIREELEPQTLPAALATQNAPAPLDASASAASAASSDIAGAVYVSCAGRGGPHFGAPSAELAIVRHALGDVPLVGFFAAGEIAHRHLYGYTGVLTVFRRAG